MSTAIFYHAGCPVCLETEQSVVDAIDRSKYQVELVHLRKQTERITEAEASASVIRSVCFLKCTNST